MADTVKNLLNTSVDDYKYSLQYCHEMPLLRELLTECVKAGHKTRAKYVEQRIRQLKEGEVMHLIKDFDVETVGELRAALADLPDDMRVLDIFGNVVCIRICQEKREKFVEVA